MIHTLKLEAYKSFISEKIDLAPLTILTGLNGSGKSTVIQAVRMLLSANNTAQNPFLPGHGTLDEIRSRYCSPTSKLLISAETVKSQTYTLTSSKSSTHYPDEPLDYVYEYISAERLGPKTNLPSNSTHKVTIGEQGEFCADYFDKLEACIVNDLLYRRETVSKTLIDQLNVWMNDISPNISFEFSLDTKHDTSNVEIDGHRATNTGFGISYSLPIVLASLVMTSAKCNDFKDKFVEDWYKSLSEKDRILMVENPEAHLHPSGQTQLGILAVLTAKAGVQVLVETHSDHFIDGVRIACKEFDFSKHALINYFSKKHEQPSSIEKIKILSNGELSNWPDGFFDQIQLNLLRLMSANQDG